MAGSTPIRCVDAADAPPPAGHYSHAAVVGNLVFVSGHLPVPGDNQHDPTADFPTQAHRALGNLSVALAAAGSSPDRIVKLTAYIVDIDDWPVFNEIYARMMGTHKPARCVVPVPALHYGYRIEIEAIATTEPVAPIEGIASSEPAS